MEIKRLENKILDVLKKLSIDFEQTDNYDKQWRNKKFYLDYVYYDGREIKIEDVKDLIIEEIMWYQRGKPHKFDLCWMCKLYKSKDKKSNCQINNLIFNFRKLHKIKAPIWACKKFR